VKTFRGIGLDKADLDSFHPETALFPDLCVNPHAWVGGVDIYATVQAHG
jgi:hypothetical protein